MIEHTCLRQHSYIEGPVFFFGCNTPPKTGSIVAFLARFTNNMSVYTTAHALFQILHVYQGIDIPHFRVDTSTPAQSISSIPGKNRHPGNWLPSLGG